MARRAAGKKAAPKRALAKKARAKSSAPTAPKKTMVPYYRAPDFRFVPATGALVRHDNEAFIVSFYVDDKVPQHHHAELMEQTDTVARYQLGEIVEDTCRREEVGVRMTAETAISLASVILDRVQTARPDLLPKAPKKKK